MNSNDILQAIASSIDPMIATWVAVTDELQRALLPLEWRYDEEAFAEFCNLHSHLHSRAPELLWICATVPDPAAKIYVLSAYRHLAHEILEDTVKLLNYRRSKRIASDIRWVATVALGLMGPPARRAVAPLLRRFRREHDEVVRAAIIWALVQIAPAAPSVRKALVDIMVTDPDSYVRGMAETAINGGDFCAAYADPETLEPQGPGEQWERLGGASRN
jgi:hypothetical protein